MRTLTFATMTALAALSAANLMGTASASTSPLVVQGNGLRQLHLGTSESRTVTVLDQLLGRPTAKVAPTPMMKNCGVDSLGYWYALGAYFKHNRLVGLSFGPAHVPAVQTVAGLRLGDALSRARSLYAHQFTTSNANGGAWFVTTATGRVDGFLNVNGALAPSATSTIMTIDVGDVGCPSMSP